MIVKTTFDDFHRIQSIWLKMDLFWQIPRREKLGLTGICDLCSKICVRLFIVSSWRCVLEQKINSVRNEYSTLCETIHGIKSMVRPQRSNHRTHLPSFRIILFSLCTFDLAFSHHTNDSRMPVDTQKYIVNTWPYLLFNCEYKHSSLPMGTIYLWIHHKAHCAAWAYGLLYFHFICIWITDWKQCV